MKVTSVSTLMALILVCVGIGFAVQNKKAKIKVEKTARQIQHGKLFKHGGKSLLDRAAEQGGDITVVADEPLGVSSEVIAPSASFLESAVCNADLVVVGTLTGETAQFNEGETFIFTDYELSVEEVVKNNGKAPISTGGSITVTRDGGTLTADSRTFKALREDFKLFPLNQRYIFFLKYIPSTGSYLAYLHGSFQLSGSKLVTFGDVPHEKSKDAVAFLAEARSLAMSNCQN